MVCFMHNKRHTSNKYDCVITVINKRIYRMYFPLFHGKIRTERNQPLRQVSHTFLNTCILWYCGFRHGRYMVWYGLVLVFLGWCRLWIGNAAICTKFTKSLMSAFSIQHKRSGISLPPLTFYGSRLSSAKHIFGAKCLKACNLSLILNAHSH